MNTQGVLVKRVLLSIATVFALAGCTGGVTTSADSSEADAQDDAKSARVGQPVTISGNEDGAKFQVTVKRIKQTRSTDGFSKPDAGKKLVAVQFKIVNTGKTGYEDSPSNGAKVIDASGQQYESDLMFSEISAGAMLPSLVKLAPGNKALGYLAFQIPKKAKVSQIQFSADSGFGETAQWNVR